MLQINHKPITRHIHEPTYLVKILIPTKNAPNDLKLRSKTVEAHNITFKRVYHHDSIPLIGLKRI